MLVGLWVLVFTLLIDERPRRGVADGVAGGHDVDAIFIAVKCVAIGLCQAVDDRLRRAEGGGRVEEEIGARRPVDLGVVPFARQDDLQIFGRARRHLDAAVDRLATFIFLAGVDRSEEHTSELQSLMRISYAVFCLKKKKISYNKHINTD